MYGEACTYQGAKADGLALLDEILQKVGGSFSKLFLLLRFLVTLLVMLLMVVFLLSTHSQHVLDAVGGVSSHLSGMSHWLENSSTNLSDGSRGSFGHSIKAERHVVNSNT